MEVDDWALNLPQRNIFEHKKSLISLETSSSKMHFKYITSCI